LTINSNHWILVYIDCASCTFWTFNPFCPTQPTSEDLEIAQHIAEQIQSEFRLSEFSVNMPEESKTFPIQKDSYNCGVFVLWYLFLFTLKAKITLPDEYGADMLRILLCAWVFHKGIKPF
jgi:hypothetical protein